MSRKEIWLEGIRVGLKAFIITYLTAIVIAFVINITVLERIQDYLYGTLKANVGFDFGLIIKTAVLIMNMSLFNTSGDVQIGILVLIILPLLGFFLAGRVENKKEGMDKIGFAIYGVASIVYTLFLTLISLIGRGELIGISINFISIRNIIMTLIITFLIQMAIGINYNVHILPGVVAARWMIRLTFSVSMIMAIIGTGYYLSKYTNSPLLILTVMGLFIPNIVAYIVFAMMGVGINVNTSFGKFLEVGQLDISYSAIPIGLKIVLLLIFIMFITFAIYKIDSKNFTKGLIGFAIIYPLICVLVAYCTVINLGVVKIVGEIRLGIGYTQAFIYPFMWVIIVGILVIAIKRVVQVIKE